MSAMAGRLPAGRLSRTPSRASRLTMPATSSRRGKGPSRLPPLLPLTLFPTLAWGVRALQNPQRIKKSDGGDASYQIDIVSGSSTHTGTTHNPTTSYAYAWDVVELDPATGALWSPIAVNNLEVKIDRTV